MTQEQKARAYDEALETARKLNSGEGVASPPDWTVYEVIFPELKESEDEKIRKAIIAHIKDMRYYDSYYNVTPDEMIAWLEKQGEHKDYYTKQELIDMGFSFTLNGDIVTPDEMMEDMKKYLAWKEKKLEKQDEKQQGKSALEATKEEKVDNANYVQVNKLFSIGDWVVANGTHYRAKIKAFIENNMVEFEDGTFETEESLLKDYHLWSIADAKPGDVLVHNSITFIFKGIEDGIVKGLCSELSDSILNFGEPKYDKDYSPATKEQRNLLFEKMHEEGYEWNEEKKELRKIVVPIFNVGDTIIKKHNSDINKFGQFTITDIAGGKYWYNDNIICDITEQDEWELVEQKSAEWSEEDEIRLDRICKTLWKNRKGDTDEIFQQEQDVNWLKSLKQRKE